VLERIARALLERESLESDELDLLIEGRPLPPDLLTPATPEAVRAPESSLTPAA
jgi:hypothetical protein